MMNPLVLLPLLAAGCVAAPAVGSVAIHGAPLALTAHQVTAHVPAAVEYKAVGEAVAVAPAAAAVVPGYHVDGEVRQISETYAEPKAVEVDVNTLPVLPAARTYAVPAPAALPVAQVKAVEVPAPVAVAPAALTYSNVNLNVPAPVPAGEAPSPDVLVQRTPVKALSRPVISYTPQITEVQPELKVIEKTYDVAVPKPVYQTQEITPVHHKYVAEPYAVPHPYAVPQPYSVPVPVAQPYHVQHHAAAVPAFPHPAVAYSGAHLTQPVITVEH